MKKLLITLLTLGSFALGACSNPVPLAMDGVQNAEGDVTTYLVLSDEGRYNGEQGEKVPSLFLENTITYVASPGSTLPDKTTITSTQENVEFETWLSYDGSGSPIRHSEVPETDGMILYAFFNYTGDFPLVDGGGGDTPPTPTGDNYYIVGEGSFVNGTEWEPDGGVLMEVNSEPLIPNCVEYMALGVEFETGDLWKICNDKEPEHDWFAGNWETGEGSAISTGAMTTVSDNFGGINIEVVTAGSYDIYLKIFNNDVNNFSIWIQASA